jgi:hypothetical protein
LRRLDGSRSLARVLHRADGRGQRSSVSNSDDTSGRLCRPDGRNRQAEALGPSAAAVASRSPAGAGTTAAPPATAGSLAVASSERRGRAGLTDGALRVGAAKLIVARGTRSLAGGGSRASRTAEQATRPSTSAKRKAADLSVRAVRGARARKGNTSGALALCRARGSGSAAAHATAAKPTGLSAAHLGGGVARGAAASDSTAARLRAPA